MHAGLIFTDYSLTEEYGITGVWIIIENTAGYLWKWQ
jgi:hypothetical protein